MPMPCYLMLEGQNQGKIEGSTKIQGHDGKILVQAVEHLVDIETDYTYKYMGRRRTINPLRNI